MEGIAMRLGTLVARTNPDKSVDVIDCIMGGPINELGRTGAYRVWTVAGGYHWSGRGSRSYHPATVVLVRCYQTIDGQTERLEECLTIDSNPKTWRALRAGMCELAGQLALSEQSEVGR